MSSLDILTQTFWLAILASVVACIGRTVIFEEIFREPREFCQEVSKNSSRILIRKFFYIFTCEYCFSHYVALATLLVTDFHLLLPDWRGMVIGFFSLVLLSNFYMKIYARISVDLQHRKVETKKTEQELAKD